MRLFSPSLPPLVVILLLVFLWFILLVLFLWFAFGPRRAPVAPKERHAEPPEFLPREDAPARPVRVVRPQGVREVTAEKADNGQDDVKDTPFDDFRKRSRRDDFDF